MAHHINLKLYKRKLTKNIVLRIAFLCFSIFGTTGFDYIEYLVFLGLGGVNVTLTFPFVLS